MTGRLGFTVQRALALLVVLVGALALPGVGLAAPVITVPPDVVAEATGPSGAKVTYTVTATDGKDVPVTCAPASGSTFALGVTTVDCRTMQGNTVTASKSFTVTVRDTTKPVLSAVASVTVEAVGSLGTVVTYTPPTATDVVDGSVPVVCAPLPGSRFPLGSTTVTCSATDKSKNTGTTTFTVTVRDRTPPTIAAHANVTAEATSSAGATVAYGLPAATDTVDPTPTVTCTPPQGVFPLGTRTVSCTARDDSGNTSATTTFTVTVRDKTPPTFPQPANLAVDATSPAGATVTYALPAASDAVDPSPKVTCKPAPGSFFPIGATPVTCHAEDDSGNESPDRTFTITVRDGAGPAFTPTPPDVSREANGPDGSIVNYPLPTAVDAIDGPRPVSCSPPSGSRFPLGSTRVTCTSTDSRGNVGTATFAVAVVDTTAPQLNAPGPVTVAGASASGSPATDAAIASFLAAARATDLVTARPAISTDAPANFPVGATTVTFTAIDAAGNRTSARAVVTVVAPAAGAAARPPAAPAQDLSPPGNVSALRVKAGDRSVTLTWKLPADSDLDRVAIRRSSAGAPSGADQVTVYEGRGTSFQDRKLRNGVEYRYLLVAYDQARNASAGVAAVALPKARLLYAPREGARIAGPPVLVWSRVGAATYYNVQLYRGKQKVLSVWPVRARFFLRSGWKYGGKSFKLEPGLYRWYVWPGLGRRSQSRYGTMLGEGTFTKVAAGRH
ncbi:MAG: HYR domain-containing protein [Actinobacteria bacterium]|nr:HYR domain-containing protein [Actinomycetota bacterium]